MPVVLLFGRNKSESFSEQLFGQGYHYHLKALSREEAKSFLRNACIASSIAVARKAQMSKKMEEEWKVLSPEAMHIDLERVPGQIEANDKRFFDRNSGLKIMIVVNDDEAIITFGAAGGAQNEFVDAKNNPSWIALEKHIWDDIVWPNLLGASPAIYKQAEAFYLAIKDHPALKEKKVTLVGHCISSIKSSLISSVELFLRRNSSQYIEIGFLPFVGLKILGYGFP